MKLVCPVQSLQRDVWKWEAWQSCFWRCSKYRFCMSVRIKERLSLLLSCSHLCLLSLWDGQQQILSVNQNPVGVLVLAKLLTSQKCKQKCENNKTRGKTRQASPACHRCLRIDFFPSPVSQRKWVRKCCLARDSPKLGSLCVCSQQSVSKSTWSGCEVSTYSYKLAFFIYLFFCCEWNNHPQRVISSVYEKLLVLWNVYPEAPLRVLKDFSLVDNLTPQLFLSFTHLRGLDLTGFVAWNSSSDPDMCCTYSWISVHMMNPELLRCSNNSWCIPTNGDMMKMGIKTHLTCIPQSNLPSFIVNPLHRQSPFLSVT